MSIPILRTKLNRPPVAEDHLHRKHLLDRLDRRLHRPLTLVSAPAGYGKSTLVSCWVEASKLPCTWVSLDEDDNDLHLFLAYFITAIQSIFPHFGSETRKYLQAANLPPTAVLASTLINELDQIEENYLLVLDDYHLITERKIHDLFSAILSHPPGTMHLVVATRRDPPLSMMELRARGQMTEIRVQELRFSADEIAQFLQQVMGMKVNEKTAAVLEEKTEGWVVGLRLALLSMRELADLDHIVEDFSDDNRYVMDYLITEVLSRQPPTIQDYLLSTAVLNRFCAPLCEAVCTAEDETGTCMITGSEFIDQLEHTNLFVIPLDNQRRWYRYHHLFQQLLLRQLKKRFRPDEITAFHQKAGSWFVQNDLLEEALYHFLSAGDITAARNLIRQSRHHVTDQEQWHRLDRWFGSLPQEAIEHDPELLIAKAWLCENRFQIPEMLRLIDQVEALVARKGTPALSSVGLTGELAALKSARYYLEGVGKQAITTAKEALEKISLHHASERAFALIVLSLAYQMTGSRNAAISVMYNALEQAYDYSQTYRTRMMFGLCFINWFENDLFDLQQVATQVLDFGLKHDLLESISFARYFLGIVHYRRNEVESAEENLVSAVKEGRAVNINTFVHSSFALALAYQAQGRQAEAQEVASSVVDHALKAGNAAIAQMARPFQAELAIRQGRDSEAHRWAQRFEPEPLAPTLRFYLPHLTWTKVLLAQKKDSARSKAADMLDRMADFFASTHNFPVLIDVKLQQALLWGLQGEHETALDALQQAVTMAQPGGHIRPFLDLGPKMAELLSRLPGPTIADGYVRQIMEAFGHDNAVALNASTQDVSTVMGPASAGVLSEPLTHREIEILRFLGPGLTNKEIASKLFISPETVKKHAQGIYRKLKVSNRRQAVAQAYHLGILSRD
jgi:LuxR family maltose regulon positive regulatory protein